MDPQPAIPAPLPPRFREVAPLGQGAFGQVWRAVDGHGRPVAVKVLDARLATSPEALWRFSAEYRLLARLGHPAFPKAYEEGYTPDGSPFYSMALVAGRPLSEPMPAERVRAVLSAIAEALASMHELGLVHGDLKRENVLVEGVSASVIDVGLAAPIGTRREAIAGTLEYMAPEVLRLAPVAPSADMYALGVLAYAMTTGVLPFQGEPAALVRAQLTQTPPSIPADDPALARLVAALLAKDAASRPDARGVLAALGHGRQEGAKALALRAGAFVGREDVLARGREVLATGGWLALTGEPGMGKTRALEALRLEALLVGRAWVSARAEGELGAAAPLRSVLSQALALAGLSADGVVAAWLEGRVSPELADLAPSSRRAALNEHVARALSAAAAALGGLAVALDDWHAADAASREGLAALCRAAAEAPIAWLVVAPDEAAMVLEPLSEAEVTALVRSRLGAEPPEALLNHLTALAEGRPSAVDALVEHAVASRQLVGTPEGWRFAPAAGEGSLSGSLERFYEAKLARLTPPARRLAAALAVAAPAGELPVLVLAGASGLAAEAPAALEALQSAGLAVGRPGGARLAHGVSAEALLRALDADEARALATRLAERLVEGPLAELPLDRLSKAARLALAGPDDRLAVELAGEAGRRSLALSATASALAFLAAAAERAGAQAPVSVLLPQADALRLLDMADRAAAAYEAVLAHPEASARDRADAGIGLAKCRQLKGDYASALEALAGACEQAESVGETARLARARLAEANMLIYLGEADTAYTRAETCLALAREAQALPLVAEGLNLLGILSVQRDLGQAENAFAMLEESLAIARGLGDGRGMGVSLDNLGNARLALGDLQGAAAAFREAADLFRRFGSETDALSPLLNQAIAEGDRACHAEALALSGRVAGLAEAAGRRFPLAAARAVEAQALLQSGRPAEADAPLNEALAIAQAINNRYVEEFVRLLRLEVWLAQGDVARAREEEAATTALNAALGHRDAEARLACLRGELARQEGDVQAAREEAERAVTSPNRLAAHRAHELLARLALQAGKPELAHPHADSARAIARAWAAPWHEAADALLIAESLVAAGKAHADSAREAMALARVGANPYALAGAGALLGDEAALAEAQGAIGPVLAPLGPEAAERLLGAWGLAGLAATPAARSGLDLRRYAELLTELGMQPDEAALSVFTLGAIAELCMADRGYVLLYDESGRLARTITRDMDAEAELTGGFSRTVAEQVLFSAEPLYVVDAMAASEWQEAASVQALALRTVVALPLATPRVILGVVYLDRAALDPLLSHADVALLGAFAAAAADAIARDRARVAASNEAAQLRSQLALASRLAAVGTLAEAKEAVLAAAMAEVGAERGAWLAADGAGELRVEAASSASMPLSRHVAQWVAERREPIGILDVSTAEGWKEHQSVQALGLRTVWCVPAGDTAVLYLDTARLSPGDPAERLPAIAALLETARPHLARLSHLD